jgi:heme-degrading monooxygenase HmoA
VFARVSTFEGVARSGGRVDPHAAERVLLALRDLDGFNGILGLADPQSGRVLAVTLWETEEPMHASEEAANQLRSETAESVSETIAGVDRYEVTFGEVSEWGAALAG